MHRFAYPQRSCARLFSSVFFDVLLASCFLLLAPFSVHAASLPFGGLIKGTEDTVYYYASDGKRYVFPTMKTYLTWYADFATVQTVSPSELTQLSIGGNVTYRPGHTLVKITTDPKVYAVSLGGVLRWVQTEALATTLYGTDWNKKIDDIPDAFFINYTIGSPITTSTDYSPSAHMKAAPDIAADKKIAPVSTTTSTSTPTSIPSQSTSTSPTTATTTSPLTFSAAKTTAQAGDVITLTAAYQGSEVISKLEIFFDRSLVKTCTTISCAGDAIVPISGTKSSYIAEVRATFQTNAILSKTLEIQIQSNGKALVQIRVGQSLIAAGQAASVIAEADSSIAVNRIDISVDGSFVKGCATGARQCQWSDYLMGANGSVHPVYARVTDSLGRTYTSKTTMITIGMNDLPGVTVTPAKSEIYAGEAVDITVTAMDNDGITSIDVMKDGALLQHCDSAQPCTARTGPWNSVGSVSFDGRATDTKGNVGTSTDPGIVQVQARATGY